MKTQIYNNMENTDKIKIDFIINTFDLKYDINNIAVRESIISHFDRYYLIGKNEIIRKSDLENNTKYLLTYKI